MEGRVEDLKEELSCLLHQAARAAVALDRADGTIRGVNYPEYRRQGLPATTAWMESLVKEMNYRVKGTEMFWNDPEGAEAILQVRSAALGDDDRLSHYLRRRPGKPFTRRPKIPTAPAQSCKS